jgi:hypothetical protein
MLSFWPCFPKLQNDNNTLFTNAESVTMTHETNIATRTPTPSGNTLPSNLPIELLPVYDWWKTNGSQFLVTLVTAGILFLGAWAFMHTGNKKSQSPMRIGPGHSLEDLEVVVAKYGSTKAGNAARLRLAKAYFDAANYEEALNAYTVCLKKGPRRGFSGVAASGGHTLSRRSTGWMRRLPPMKLSTGSRTDTFCSRWPRWASPASMPCRARRKMPKSCSKT